MQYDSVDGAIPVHQQIAYSHSVIEAVVPMTRLQYAPMTGVAAHQVTSTM